MSGGHKLRLLFRSDQQASKAEHVPTVYDGPIRWTGLVDICGGHKLHLLVSSDQQMQTGVCRSKQVRQSMYPPCM